VLLAFYGFRSEESINPCPGWLDLIFTAYLIFEDLPPDELHRFEVRVELVDDRERLLQQVLWKFPTWVSGLIRRFRWELLTYYVAHGDIVRQADLLAGPDEFAAAARPNKSYN
jgi:hypothetical protein